MRYFCPKCRNRLDTKDEKPKVVTCHVCGYNVDLASFKDGMLAIPRIILLATVLGFGLGIAVAQIIFIHELGKMPASWGGLAGAWCMLTIFIPSITMLVLIPLGFGINALIESVLYGPSLGQRLWMGGEGASVGALAGLIAFLGGIVGPLAGGLVGFLMGFAGCGVKTIRATLLGGAVGVVLSVIVYGGLVAAEYLYLIATVGALYGIIAGLVGGFEGVAYGAAAAWLIPRLALNVLGANHQLFVFAVIFSPLTGIAIGRAQRKQRAKAAAEKIRNTSTPEGPPSQPSQ